MIIYGITRVLLEIMHRTTVKPEVIISQGIGLGYKKSTQKFILVLKQAKKCLGETILPRMKCQEANNLN